MMGDAQWQSLSDAVLELGAPSIVVQVLAEADTLRDRLATLRGAALLSSPDVTIPGYACHCDVCIELRKG
jgi:hypothetical protein